MRTSEIATGMPSLPSRLATDRRVSVEEGDWHGWVVAMSIRGNVCVGRIRSRRRRACRSSESILGLNSRRETSAVSGDSGRDVTSDDSRESNDVDRIFSLKGGSARDFGDKACRRFSAASSLRSSVFWRSRAAWSCSCTLVSRRLTSLSFFLAFRSLAFENTRAISASVLAFCTCSIVCSCPGGGTGLGL